MVDSGESRMRLSTLWRGLCVDTMRTREPSGRPNRWKIHPFGASRATDWQSDATQKMRPEAVTPSGRKGLMIADRVSQHLPVSHRHCRFCNAKGAAGAEGAS